MRSWLSVLTLVFLSACSGPEAAVMTPAARAAKLLPADRRLASLYEQSCRKCHATGLNAAPLTGNGRDWNLKLEKGPVRMSQSVERGTEHMPPGGDCKACDRTDILALIQFMVGRSSSVMAP